MQGRRSLRSEQKSMLSFPRCKSNLILLAPWQQRAKQRCHKTLARSPLEKSIDFWLKALFRLGRGDWGVNTVGIGGKRKCFSCAQQRPIFGDDEKVFFSYRWTKKDAVGRGLTRKNKGRRRKSYTKVSEWLWSLLLTQRNANLFWCQVVTQNG